MAKSPQRNPSADRIWLARVLADLLDQRFRIPGTGIRFGLDPIIGLIPGIGDIVSNLTGSVILLLAAQLGLPKIALLRMALNIGVNAAIGAIPGVGDIFSIWFRSNAKNAALLERYAGGRHTRRASAGDWLFVIAIVAALVAVTVAVALALLWLFKQLWTAL
jgi:hypothetical protein